MSKQDRLTPTAGGSMTGVVSRSHASRGRVYLAAVLLSIGALVSSVAGCGQDSGEANEDPGAVALDETCEHMRGGPSIAVTATEDAASAPSISAEHTRHDITLAPSAPSSVRFDAGDAGDFWILMDRNLALSITDATNAAVMISETHTGDAVPCADVGAVYHIVALEVGSHTLTIEPSAGIAEVRMVIEHGDE